MKPKKGVYNVAIKIKRNKNQNETKKRVLETYTQHKHITQSL